MVWASRRSKSNKPSGKLSRRPPSPPGPGPGRWTDAEVAPEEPSGSAGAAGSAAPGASGRCGWGGVAGVAGGWRRGNRGGALTLRFW